MHPVRERRVGGRAEARLEHPAVEQHAKLLPLSVDENANVGAGLLVVAGCEALIDVFGGAVSVGERARGARSDVAGRGSPAA